MKYQLPPMPEGAMNLILQGLGKLTVDTGAGTVALQLEQIMAEQQEVAMKARFAPPPKKEEEEQSDKPAPKKSARKPATKVLPKKD